MSACKTAQGDAKQPEQAIHLAATMLFVGFQTVIGTMWTMRDHDGPFVARVVYEHLFNNNSEQLDHNVIPYALDDAVQQRMSCTGALCDVHSYRCLKFESFRSRGQVHAAIDRIRTSTSCSRSITTFV